MAFTEFYGKILNIIKGTFRLGNSVFIKIVINFTYTYFHSLNFFDGIRVDIT
jgi:hypothetical protein